MNNNKLKRSAFTIVELLVSIMIIGILSSLGYQQYTKAVDTAKAKGMIQLIKKANTANADFFRTYGEYPTDIRNPNLLKMLKAMEFKVDDMGTATDIIDDKVLANLGPRTNIELNDTLQIGSPYTDGAGTQNTFRYIIIRNVPGRIAAEVAKEINGKVNQTTDCGLAKDNYFVGITRSVTGGSVINGSNCIIDADLTASSGNNNNVDIWYTFSRSLDTSAAWN